MTNLSNMAGAIRETVERIEKLQADKKEIAGDITEVFREAKRNGLDVKTLREVVKLRKLREDERSEMEFNREVYMKALGLSADLS